MADRLKNRVDDGITTHKAMARDLPDWLNTIETKKLELDLLMNETTICIKRNLIRDKIHELENLYGRVSILFQSFQAPILVEG